MNEKLTPLTSSCFFTEPSVVQIGHGSPKPTGTTKCCDSFWRSKIAAPANAATWSEAIPALGAFLYRLDHLVLGWAAHYRGYRKYVYLCKFGHNIHVQLCQGN
jgi:hypothetical protein